MEKKINIAELLKDCPKGMELDCTAYDNVSFDKISSDKKAVYPIFCYITDEEGNRSSISFTENGCESKRYGAKCVIFPKGRTTWEGFQRPFKDGDILSYQFSGFKNRSIYIYMHHPIMNTTYYVAVSGDTDSEFMINNKKGRALNGYNDTVRFATEEEKQKLFQVIKDNWYKWNAGTKTLEKLPRFKVGNRIRKKGEYSAYTISHINYGHYFCGNYVICDIGDNDWELVPDKFDIKTLKPFYQVLVRDNDDQMWTADMFSFYNEKNIYPFVCVGHCVNQCIPYEGNEHLLGKTDDCDDFYKTWVK